MHIAPNKIHTTMGGFLRSFCSARSLALCCSLAGLGLASAVADPVDGAPGSGRRDERGQQQSQSQSRGDLRAQPQPADNRELDARQSEARADEHRRTQQEQAIRNAEAPRRNGRLTEDQRRDLRRQINEAGQDIYATPPRR